MRAIFAFSSGQEDDLSAERSRVEFSVEIALGYRKETQKQRPAATDDGSVGLSMGERERVRKRGDR